MQPNRAFIFLDTVPQRQGSGAALRLYSNVRAYLDLGFEVEVIQIGTRVDETEPARDLNPVKWTRVFEPAPEASIWGRLMFRMGIPAKAAVEYFVDRSRLTVREVEKRRQQAPDAVFHMEGEFMASALPRMRALPRRIWSVHDLPSTVSAASTRIACEAQGRQPSVAELRELRFATKYEHFIARHAALALCIADYDVSRIRDWGCRAVEYLPMSIPDEEVEESDREWLPDGRLRLLHLGSVSHLPSYRSLEFLFDKVWPHLPPEVSNRISLNVVGTVDPGNERTKRIMDLARPYSNVVFKGFVKDVRAEYRESDVQVVASTDATGLRTRIIESFAYGLPVLSTSTAAQGIRGLKPGETLLVADDAAQFVNVLSELCGSEKLLTKLSSSGRAFYEQNNSRAAVAASLGESLRRHLGVEV